MVLNEVAQWTALIFLGVVALGLTRQLGQFLISRREELELDGPDIGSKLSPLLVGDESIQSIEALYSSSARGLTLVCVLNDRCLGCAGLLEDLLRRGRPEGVPIIALLSAHDAEFVAQAEAAFSLVVIDPASERAKAAGINATPFLLGVDQSGHIKHRAIGGAMHSMVAEWLGESSPPTNRADSAVDPKRKEEVVYL